MFHNWRQKDIKVRFFSGYENPVTKSKNKYRECYSKNLIYLKKKVYIKNRIKNKWLLKNKITESFKYF